jgi:hypothetical protein
MSSHICCKCMFKMFHLFQSYVAFKCFILHVFHVVRRVRGHGGVMAARHGRGEWGAASRWAANVSCGALGAGGRGQDERGKRMGARCVDGAGSNRGGSGGLRASRTDAQRRDAHTSRQISGRGIGCAGAKNVRPMKSSSGQHVQILKFSCVYLVEMEYV